MPWTEVTNPTASDWSEVAVTPSLVNYEIGSPIGLLLALTYSSSGFSNPWVEITVNPSG